MKAIYIQYNIFYIIISFLIVCNIGLGIFVYFNRGCNSYRDRVSFLNIGQGDAIYIENTVGQTMLIDTGNKNSGVLKQIQRVTHCSKVRIDTLMLTHPDQDHIGEVMTLIQKGYVKQIIHNGFLDINQNSENQIENDIEEIVQTKKIPTWNMLEYPSIDFKNFTINYLYPTEEPYQDKKGKSKSVDDNDYSIILKLTHDVQSFMLTGDAPIKVEKEMISNYCTQTCPVLESTVLKLGHHGSKNSSDIDFLKIVNAKEYIVSAGLNNKFNHPNEETIQRVISNKKDSLIRETSLDGNIVYLLN